MYFSIEQEKRSGILDSRNSKSTTDLVFETIPDEETIEVSGVEMNNFLKTSTLMHDNTNVVIPDNSPDHSIVYLNEHDQFLISVTGTPFFQKRILAEQNFLRILDISAEDACRLDVVVTTPRYANPHEAGEVSGLSFCQ